MNNPLIIIKHIGTGYLRVFASVFRIFLFIAGAIGASALVAFPIWYAATKHTAAFTLVSVILLVSGLGFALVRAIVRSAAEQGGFGRYFRLSVVPFLLSLGRVAVAIGSLYGVAILFSNRMYAFAIGSSVAFLLLSGYFLYKRGKQKQ